MTALNIRNDRTKDSVKSMNTLKCYSSDEPVQGFLKAHFQSSCNARLDRSLKTFWNRRSQEPSWTYSQLFYGKYIRRSSFYSFLTVFWILSGRIRRKIFCVTFGSLRTLWTESAKRITFEFFYFLEALEDSKWKFSNRNWYFQREIWKNIRLPDV